MKNLLGIIALATLILGCAAMASDAPKETKIAQGKLDSLSYALGVSISENMVKQGYTDLNYQELSKGIEEGLEGTSYVKGRECGMLIQRIRTEQKKLQFSENLEKSEKFLEEKAKEEGVKKTASGLLYKVITPGTGATPTRNDQVTVHYDGTLIDGTSFDSSRKKGRPYTTKVTSVIKGWIEGLQLMQVGSTYEFYIHPDLAYGANPRPGVIRPNDALVFNIELISID